MELAVRSPTLHGAQVGLDSVAEVTGHEARWSRKGRVCKATSGPGAMKRPYRARQVAGWAKLSGEVVIVVGMGRGEGVG